MEVRALNGEDRMPDSAPGGLARGDRELLLFALALFGDLLGDFEPESRRLRHHVIELLDQRGKLLRRQRLWRIRHPDER